jgi:hypothetical protein
VRRADAHPAVEDRPGKDILRVGCRTLWNDLLAAGRTPAFGAGPVPPLRLVSTRHQDGSDNVLL